MDENYYHCFLLLLIPASSAFSVLTFAIMAVLGQGFRETDSEMETSLGHAIGISVYGEHEESRIEQRGSLTVMQS